MGTPGKHCAIEHCSRPIEARSWCQRHYSRWLIHKDPLHLRHRNICKIIGCGKFVNGHNLCSTHYQRWYKGSGNPYTLLRKPNGSGSICGGYKLIHDKGHQRKEHRVIMEHHLGRPLLRTEIVHHRDGNGLNNKIENLELMTRREHLLHHKSEMEPFRKQSLKNFRGELHPSSKLTELQVKCIRKSSWEACKQLSKQFGTTMSNIKTIRSGYTWRHLLRSRNAT